MSGAHTLNISGGIYAGPGTTINPTLSCTTVAFTGSGNQALIRLDNAGTLTISSAINAIGGLSKMGSGALTLSHDNSATLTGNINFFGGAVNVSADNNLGNAANQLAFFGGTLAVTTSFTTDRPVILHPAGGTIAVVAGQTLTLSGNSSITESGTPAGSLTMAGPGTLELACDGSTRTGSTIIAGGLLRILNAYALDGAGTATATVNAGTLELAGVTSYAPLTLNNNAVLRGTGIAESAGVKTIASGANVFIEVVSAGDSLGLGPDPNDLTGGGGGSTITVRGAIDSGLAQVIAENDNNYVGNWTVVNNAGGGVVLLQLNSAAALGAAGNTVTVNANTVLGSSIAVLPASIILAGGTLAPVFGDRTFSGPIALTAASGITLFDPLNPSSAWNVTITGVISGAANLTICPAGSPASMQMLTFSGANTYTGATTVNAGTLLLNGNGRVGGDVTLNHGAGLTIDETTGAGVERRAAYRHQGPE